MRGSGNIFFPIAVFGIVIAAAIGQSIFLSRRRNNRRMELLMLATGMGWDFRPERDDDFTAGWGFLQRLKQGHDRYAFNIIRGESLGHKVFVFDYHFVTGSGKSKRNHDLTFLMLIVPEVFPQLTVRRETLASKVASALGFEDINFESAEFSRTFSVRSKDKKFAYDVCHPGMIEFLLAHRDIDLEIQGPAIVLTFPKQLSAPAIGTWLQRLLQIRSLLPGYLFNRS